MRVGGNPYQSTSPTYDSRHAARGCEGYPAPNGVNVAGEVPVGNCGVAMGIKGGNLFKAPGAGRVSPTVPHEAGRGGRERKANHKAHGRLYAGNGQQ